MSKIRDHNQCAQTKQVARSTQEHSTVNACSQKLQAKPKEIGGRKQGLDPVRYNDWEVNGIASDF